MAAEVSHVDDGHQGLLQEQQDSSSAPVDFLPSGKTPAGRFRHVATFNSISRAPRWLWNSGITCAFLASLIFSFSALCVKLTGGRIPVLEVCFIRSSISFGLTIILMTSTGMSPIFGHRKNWRLLFLRGCSGACSMAAYYVGLFLLPLGDAVTINLVGPAVTATAARIFLKEPLGYRGMAGCLLSLAGVIVMSRPPFLFGGAEWQRKRALGVAASMLSAFTGAASSMTIRVIGRREQAAVIALWFHTCTMVLSSLPLALGIPAKFSLLAAKDFGLMLCIACTSFLAQLLSTRGLQMVVAAKAASMRFTQVFYSYILGAIFFHEHISRGGILGVLMILAGVLMVSLRSNSKSQTAAISPTAAAATAEHLTATEPNNVKAEYGEDKSAEQEEAQLLILAAETLQKDSAEAGVDAAVLVVDKSAKPTAANDTAGDVELSLQSGPSAFLQSQAPLPPPPAAAHADYEEQLALVAAETAAALAGELCPATTASVAATRQASLEIELFGEVRARRRSSTGTPAAVNHEASTLQPAPSVPDLVIAAAVAIPAVDMPSFGSYRGLSRQVSGWLAANLLAASPGEGMSDSSSIRPADDAGACDSSEGGAGILAQCCHDGQTSTTVSRQASGWWPSRLSEVHPTAAEQSPTSTGLQAEAVSGSSAVRSPAERQERELSFATQGLNISAVGGTAQPARGDHGAFGNASDSESIKQAVRASSRLAINGAADEVIVVDINNMLKHV